MLDISKILTEELEKADKSKNRESEKPGCLMLSLVKRIKNWGDLLKIIDSDDIYSKDDIKGLEHDPHLTILFGYESQVTANELKELTSNITKPISLKLVKINYFEADDFDVVKIQVESEDLLEVHKLCKELPHHLTYENYSPHITIAYVKKSRGKKYEKNIKPIILEANTFVFSTGEKKKTEWKIKKKYKYSIELNESYLNEWSNLTPALKLNHGLLNKSGQNIVTYNGQEVVNFIISRINDGILYLEHFLSVKEGQGFARATIEMLFSKLPKVNTIRLQCKDGILPFWQKVGGIVVNKDKNYNLVDINRQNIS